MTRRIDQVKIEVLQKRVNMEIIFAIFFKTGSKLLLLQT